MAEEGSAVLKGGQVIKPIRHTIQSFAILCAASVCVAVSGSASEHETFERRPVPENHRAAVGSVVSLGLIAYQKDYAAAVATDEMAARGMFDDTRVRGWVTDRKGDAWRVVYVGDVAGEMRALYRIDVENGEIRPQTYQSYPDGLALTKMQQGMWDARQLALASPPPSCADGLNSVVLPMTKDDGTLQGYFVYLLSATADPNIIQLGGHHRVQIARDAKRILGSVSFTDSCVTLDKTQDGPLLVTHGLAETPEEPHVILSLLHGRELFVATVANDVIWSVSGIEVAVIPRRASDGD